MKKFDKVLEQANREIYNPAGLNILSPRRTAFLFVSPRGARGGSACPRDLGTHLILLFLFQIEIEYY